MRSTSKSGQSLESVVPLDAFVDRRAWKVTATSFQNGEGNPQHAVDGNPSTFWHSQYSPQKPGLPHSITVDMAAPTSIKSVLLTPRAEGNNGRIRDYDLYLSDDGKNFGAPVLSGTARDEGTIQTLTLPTPRTARFLRLVWKSEYSGQGLG